MYRQGAVSNIPLTCHISQAYLAIHASAGSKANQAHSLIRLLAMVLLLQQNQLQTLTTVGKMEQAVIVQGEHEYFHYVTLLLTYGCSK